MFRAVDFFWLKCCKLFNFTKSPLRCLRFVRRQLDVNATHV